MFTIMVWIVWAAVIYVALVLAGICVSALVLASQAMNQNQHETATWKAREAAIWKAING